MEMLNLSRVLLNLRDATQKDLLTWERSPETETTFQTRLGEGIVRIWKGTYKDIVYLATFDANDNLIHEYEPADEQEARLATEAYFAVRSKTLNLGRLEKTIFDDLERRVKST